MGVPKQNGAIQDNRTPIQDADDAIAEDITWLSEKNRLTVKKNHRSFPDVIILNRIRILILQKNLAHGLRLQSRSIKCI